MLDSPAFTAAAALALGVLAIAAIIAPIASSLVGSTHAALAHATDADAVARATGSSTARVLAEVVSSVGPLLLAAAAGAVAATAALTRSLFIPRRTVRGAPSIPPEPATDAALGLARGAIIAAVAATFLVAHLPALGGLASSVAPPRALALHVLAHVAVAALLLATADVVIRHRRHAAALRMTAREMRDDARNAGADPQARRRLRDAHGYDPRERLRDATLVLVGADAAVALRYAPGLPAPVIVTSARGLARQQLLSAARVLGIPSLADDTLAASLLTGVTPSDHAALARALAAIT